jgi:hypothetical protein
MLTLSPLGAAAAALLSDDARQRYVEKIKGAAASVEGALLAFKSKCQQDYQLLVREHHALCVDRSAPTPTPGPADPFAHAPVCLPSV